MSFLYPTVSDISVSLNSGSFLNKTDYNLFYNNTESDFWFTTSDKDAIEVAAYDLNENLVFWKSLENLGSVKDSTFSYYNDRNNVVSFFTSDFLFTYPTHKTENVLLTPLVDFSSSLITSGDYILSYQFTRYLAGSPTNTLYIKEISSDKTELKLLPSKNTTDEYTAFCKNKIQLKTVSPLYVLLTKHCPYTDLYNNTKENNITSVNLIKNLFFIPNDGLFVEFLKNIYEDFVKYSNVSDEKIQSVVRLQGIKTYFTNYLLLSSNDTVSFIDVKNKFSEFVKNRVNILFVNFKSEIYDSAKQYLFYLFVDVYFSKIHTFLEDKYKTKYTDPLKNALCFGTGQYIPILITSYVDERVTESDPLTLLVKLQTPLNNELSIKSNVWVSNIGMLPILFNSIFKFPTTSNLVKIAPPDFTIVPDEVVYTNTNTYYNSEDLKITDHNSDLVELSKKINELNVDYTSLNNFIVFSSAELRHNIFKNKMISLCNISSSLSTLETAYSSSGYTYSHYTSEKSEFLDQKSNIIGSFDGFDSFLFKTGYYEYSSVTNTFSSASYVEYLDEETKRYDKYNRDSLVNNTPDHIIVDSNNDDYLIFLSMIGHYFDNIYLYIKSLPVERSTENINTFSNNVLREMLQSFGWKIDSSNVSLNLSDNYLDKQLGGSFDISANDRNREIWNRILNTLPIIYKTKGTDACIKMVLSCFGIPSTLISVKEYGGIDYTNTNKTSYTIDEKVLMLTFVGNGEYISIPYNSSIQTVEFKVSLDVKTECEFYKKIPLFVKYNQTNTIDWTIGVYKEPSKSMGRVYFDLNDSEILSDLLPIFNGNIFNIMVRKNNPDGLFEYQPTVDIVPTKYDLWVQQKEDSRTIYNSKKSKILTKSDNVKFADIGTLFIGNYTNVKLFHGLLDKILIWEDVITDDVYIDHCNNLSSYSYNGDGVLYETLYFRMSFDYPIDLSTTNPTVIVNANEHYSSSIYALANNFGIIGYSASFDNCTFVSHSMYPYQFKDVSYNQTYTVSSYGPNKFKNEKIKKFELDVVSRLDPTSRSTSYKNQSLSPDSNNLGLFADPNNYKNSDIFRYFGDYRLLSTISDPSQMFDDKYYPLKEIRDQYNNSGNKRILCTEVFTLYKLYFDKSIFETIKQLLPARNTISTGILIEPTVLERPKYQYKRLMSTACNVEVTSSVTPPVMESLNQSINTLSVNNKIYSGGKISGGFIFVDFRTDKSIASTIYEHVPFYISEGPRLLTDPLEIEFLTKQSQLIYVDSGWVKKYPTSAGIGVIETHPDWVIPAQDFGPTGPTDLPTIPNFFFNTGVLPGYYSTGSGYFYLKNCYFYIKQNKTSVDLSDGFQKNITTTIDLSNINLVTKTYPVYVNSGIISDIQNYEELGVQCDDSGKIIESVFSGSNVRYLVKNWQILPTYVTLGEHLKPQPVSVNDLFYYTTEVWDKNFYESLIYTSSFNIKHDSSIFNNPIIDGYSPVIQTDSSGYIFKHDIGTFKLSPNSKTNNLYQSSSLPNPGGIYVYTVTGSIVSTQYTETMVGKSRNHLTNKRLLFSNDAYPTTSHKTNFIRFVKSRQTRDTTTDSMGFSDNSLPIQSINVSNINVIQTDNVLKK